MIQQINLYHPIFRKQEKKFSALAMLQGAAALLAGVGVIYAVMAWQIHSMREDLVQADKQLAAATRRFEDATQKFSPGAQGKTLEDNVANLEKQVAERLRVREILSRGIFSNTTGYSDFFVAFARQHVSGIWLTAFGITGAGEDMRMQGRTTDPAQVPRYVQRLSAEKVLVGKEFQVFVMSRPEKKEGVATEPSYIEFQFRTGLSKPPGKS